MSFVNYPLADAVARINNAIDRKSPDVCVLGSKLIHGVLSVLQEEGFVGEFSEKTSGSSFFYKVSLLYKNRGASTIREFRIVSKPSCRVYEGSSINSLCKGLGVFIISTNKGIVSDKKARELNVGGEVLCKVV
jgi:small subunit ribosomal protein S8